MKDRIGAGKFVYGGRETNKREKACVFEYSKRGGRGRTLVGLVAVSKGLGGRGGNKKN